MLANQTHKNQLKKCRKYLVNQESQQENDKNKANKKPVEQIVMEAELDHKS